MSIEEFMRGMFDVGIGVRVDLQPSGEWRVTLYRGDPHLGEFRHAMAMTWEAAREKVLANDKWSSSAVPMDPA